MFCKLSLNIHNPILDPLIDPTTSSYKDLGTSEVVEGQVLRMGPPNLIVVERRMMPCYDGELQ